jgi:hypothetical protein
MSVSALWISAEDGCRWRGSARPGQQRHNGQSETTYESTKVVTQKEKEKKEEYKTIKTNEC